MFGLNEYHWNPIVGCDEISIGCKRCYAKELTQRQKKAGLQYFEKGFEVNLLHDKITIPIKRRQPAFYHVCSMSDLFNPKVDDGFLDTLFNVMKDCQRHIFFISTKYTSRMSHYLKGKTIPNNILIGVSIENEEVGINRIADLRTINCLGKFILFEPLLSDVSNLDITGIKWVIVGGQYGAKSIPMQKKWVFTILMKCKEQNIPFYFKQWGAYGEDGRRRSKKANGNLINGKVYEELPTLSDTYETVVFSDTYKIPVSNIA